MFYICCYVALFIMNTETIVMLVAYLIIYAACDLNRKEESKIPFLSKWWFVKVIMVTIAGVMLTNYV